VGRSVSGPNIARTHLARMRDLEGVSASHTVSVERRHDPSTRVGTGRGQPCGVIDGAAAWHRMEVSRFSRGGEEPNLSRQNSVAAGFFNVGLGGFVGSAIATGAPQRRVASAASLGDKLRRSGVTLITAELGRTPTGPAWVLTVETPDQHVVTVNAALSSDQDPHSTVTAEDVAARVMHYLSTRTA
jgi:hypothetical protein